MSIFIKTIGGILISLIVCITISKHTKDIALILCIAVSCMVAAVALSYLTPVRDLILRLQMLGDLNSTMLSVILKAMGVGLLSQITTSVCNDAGNTTLGKTLQFLACAVLLCLSVPLLEELTEIVESILENL